MDDVPPAEEASPVIRYGFAAIFIAACLYDLEFGVRVGGVFLLAMCVYELVRGRVPLMGYFWNTKNYLYGPAALAVAAGMIFISTFFILAPDLVIRFAALLIPMKGDR